MFVQRRLAMRAHVGAAPPHQLALARARSNRLLQLTAALLLSAWCVACSPPDSDKRQWLVGKWQSSRLTTPLYMHPNGEWEIKQDGGAVLQYGLWEYTHKQLVWTVKQQNEISRDVNPVVSLKPDAFALRENDQSLTVFKRLPL